MSFTVETTKFDGPLDLMLHLIKEQQLDIFDLDSEMGIYFKSHAIQMKYNYKGEEYILNMIDTQGHVDFSYEVSRSIAACEGA